MIPYYPFSPAVDRLIELALTEDLCGGDLTSDPIFAADEKASGTVVAKSALVVAGLGLFARVLEFVDRDCRVEMTVADGDPVQPGAGLARASGSVRSLLRAERTALNFLRHLSGVATLTHLCVAAAGVDGPRIADTRKTTPGFRELEKYAVRMGGGHNHRFNLGAAVMIKDNHIAAAGSIAEAVRRVREAVPHTARIEVETTDLDEVAQALEAGADIIMLDNMSNEEMSEGVKLCRGRAITEASGNVTLDRIASLCSVGVDVISSGALTHSAPAADISFDLD
jgi:nicotinate-nucleotide pyrophosphorylase (carboxylating)